MRQMTLEEARKRKGFNWTQERLEAESGVNQATISKIERGERPNPTNDTVTKLERALRLQRGTLVFDQVMEKAS